MNSLLSVNGIKLSFDNLELINNLSFNILKGDIVTVWGANGSGKTSLVKSLIGELKPNEGSIELIESFGYASDRPILWESLTLKENIDIVSSLYKVPPDLTLYKRLRLDKYKRVRAGSLSLGTRKKLNFILAMVHSPSLIIVDEPFNSMDWDSTEILKSWLTNYINSGGGVLLTTNRYDIKKSFNSRVVYL